MKRIAATGTLAALATSLIAGGAMAATDYVNNGVVPPREYQVGTVGPVTSPDEQAKVPTASIYDPNEAALIGEKSVNQYTFEDAKADNAGGSYKSEAARLR